MGKFLMPIVEEVKEVLSNINQEEVEGLVENIHKDKRIFIDGEGRSGFVGKCFAMRLMHLGFEVYVIGGANTPSFQDEDLLVCVSGSGNTPCVIINAKKAKERDTKVITVTNNCDSSLAKISNKVILLDATVRGDKKNRKSIQLLGSLFDQSVHLLLDSVCLMISKRDSISNQQANKKHI